MLLKQLHFAMHVDPCGFAFVKYVGYSSSTKMQDGLDEMCALKARGQIPTLAARLLVAVATASSLVAARGASLHLRQPEAGHAKPRPVRHALPHASA